MDCTLSPASSETIPSAVRESSRSQRGLSSATTDGTKQPAWLDRDENRLGRRFFRSGNGRGGISSP